MAKLYMKPGVLPHNLWIAAALSRMPQVAITVTSGVDGTHKIDSPHYSGNALDIRTHDQPDPHQFATDLQKELGKDYLVIFEDEGTPNEHLHVQFQLAKAK